MSKQQKKVISLKKIQVEPIHENEVYNHAETPKKTKTSIQLEIDTLRMQLTQLEVEKEQKTEELESFIALETKKLEDEKQVQLEKAKEEGYATGFAQGEQQAKDACTSYLEQATNIVKKSEQDYLNTLEKHTNAIVRLAITVAEKIIDHEITDNEELFLHIVQKALEQLKDTSTISIYVHPKQYDYIYAQKEELEQLIGDDEVLYLYADQHLQENDCIIRHPFGQIDAGIDTQLRQIKRALEEKIMEN